MNLVILIGMVLLGSPSEPNHHPLTDPDLNFCREMTADNQPCITVDNETSTRQILDELEYVELDEMEATLGFDTADYLPEGFNPHEEYIDLDTFVYIELDEEEVEINTENLPESFDPYAPPADIMDISYIDLDKEEIMYPEVDTRAYLPEGFDPYERNYITVAEKFNDQLIFVRATVASVD